MGRLLVKGFFKNRILAVKNLIFQIVRTQLLIRKQKIKGDEIFVNLSFDISISWMY